MSLIWVVIFRTIVSFSTFWDPSLSVSCALSLWYVERSVEKGLFFCFVCCGYSRSVRCVTYSTLQNKSHTFVAAFGKQFFLISLPAISTVQYNLCKSLCYAIHTCIFAQLSLENYSKYDLFLDNIFFCLSKKGKLVIFAFFHPKKHYWAQNMPLGGYFL